MGRFRRIPHRRAIMRFSAALILCAVIGLIGLAQVTPAAAQVTSQTSPLNVDFNVNFAGGILSPSRIPVYAGTRVIWVNRQLAGNQTVTSDTGIFASGTLQPGQSFAYTFNQPGTYPFHSDTAPGIKGVVVVLPAMPVQVQIPPPPPQRATPSGFQLPQSSVPLLPQQPPIVQLPPSNVQLGQSLPPEAPPPAYLPLASAPPPPALPTPSGYGTYGYTGTGPYLPAPPHAGGGGGATSFTGGSDY